MKSPELIMAPEAAQNTSKRLSSFFNFMALLVIDHFF